MPSTHHYYHVTFRLEICSNLVRTKSYLQWCYAIFSFPFGVVNKCLLLMDETAMRDGSNFFAPIYLLVYWGYFEAWWGLQEHGWLKGGCITEWPITAFITQDILILTAPRTSFRHLHRESASLKIINNTVCALQLLDSLTWVLRYLIFFILSFLSFSGASPFFQERMLQFIANKCRQNTEDCFLIVHKQKNWVWQSCSLMTRDIGSSLGCCSPVIELYPLPAYSSMPHVGSIHLEEKGNVLLPSINHAKICLDSTAFASQYSGLDDIISWESYHPLIWPWSKGENRREYGVIYLLTHD